MMTIIITVGGCCCAQIILQQHQTRILKCSSYADAKIFWTGQFMPKRLLHGGSCQCQINLYAFFCIAEYVQGMCVHPWGSGGNRGGAYMFNSLQILQFHLYVRHIEVKVRVYTLPDGKSMAADICIYSSNWIPERRLRVFPFEDKFYAFFLSLNEKVGRIWSYIRRWPEGSLHTICMWNFIHVLASNRPSSSVRLKWSCFFVGYIQE